MKQQGLSVKSLYADFISTEVLEMEDGSEYEIELMTPEAFLAGLK